MPPPPGVRRISSTVAVTWSGSRASARCWAGLDSRHKTPISMATTVVSWPANSRFTHRSAIRWITPSCCSARSDGGMRLLIGKLNRHADAFSAQCRARIVP
jgi:hypothetical protein